MARPQFALIFATIVVASLSARATPVWNDFSDLLRTGGDTSILVRTPTAQAYRNPAQNLSADALATHLQGDKFFEKKFSDDPSRSDYGLGPVYNNISCGGCHTLDGRGTLPVLGMGSTWTQLRTNEAIFLRISLADRVPRNFDAGDNWGAPVAVPGYGTQLFHVGSFGVRDDFPGTGQAQLFIKLERSTFTYPDGTVVQLKKPIFKIENPYDPRLTQADVRTSPRMTPPMIGLGLLEAIPEKDILAVAAQDMSALGIHGHPNWVIDRRKELAGDASPVSLGRFGLKASTPSVFHQSLGALNGDIGVTNPTFPAESIFGTALFDLFKPKWKPSLEVDDAFSDALVFYASTLAVPTRRDIDDLEVRRGARLFTSVGCANCHQPYYMTGDHAIPELAHQLIAPFTDLLLHDMGEGLADGRSDFHASGREWRTSPLWGIGLNQVVNLRAGFLHDGRASTFEEAILWHAGEAEITRGNFVKLGATDRKAVVRFLKSL